MDELVTRLEENVGVDGTAARGLIVIVVQFLAREAPPEAMAPLIARHPWIGDIAAEAPEPAATAAANRHFGGMARLMEIANRMMAFGLTMGQVQEAVREIVDYARETVDGESVDGVVRSIPGLRQLV